jgi:phospholipid/cholesterol/gamma-HCH transport system substrate-binding protein
MKTGFSTFLAGMLIFLGVGCSQQGYRLHARFSNLQQLKPGDPVLVAGIEVGRVERIALNPGAQSTVTMKIKRSVVVKTDSIAKIRSAAPPGQAYVALEGGSLSAAAAVQDATLSTTELPGQ